MQNFKQGYCIDCKSTKFLYDKLRCGYHYWQDNTNRKTGANISSWFDYHIANSGNICENCGTVLVFSSKEIAESCQAHILPKKLFPSVKDHLSNHLLLGGLAQECSCHGQYDSSWHKASRMPVITLARIRFESFKFNISKIDITKLPDLFINSL